MCDGAAHFVFEFEPRHGFGVHVGVEQFKAGLARGLGAAHGGIGIAHEFFRRESAAIAYGDSDADRGIDFVSFDLEWVFEEILDTLGHEGSSGEFVDVVEQEHEFVATEARHSTTAASESIHDAQSGGQPFGK